MKSPRYAPAGLLVEHQSCRVMLDGGPEAVPIGKLDAWLVTDERAELMREIRRLEAGPETLFLATFVTASPLFRTQTFRKVAFPDRSLATLARAKGLEPQVDAYSSFGLTIAPHPVVHTSHPTYGYLIEAACKKIVWAPEFLEFPSWAAGADLMFAEAAGWNRPIRFRGGVAATLPS